MKQTLEEAIGTFLEGLKAAKRSPKTIRWYGDILRRVAAGTTEFTADGIRHYLAIRADAPGRKGATLSDATLSADHRALRAFCAWLIRTKRIPADDNPMDMIDRPKVAQARVRVAQAATVRALLTAANASIYTRRDRALVLILADTGARVSEFLQITMDNLQVVHANGLEYGQAVVIGKGKHERLLLIGPDAMTELASWIAERPADAGQTIWCSDHGGKLTDSGVRQLLRRLSERAGLPEVMNPHAFRHGAAVDFLEAGGDIRTLQLMLGHSQITTTMRYLRLADSVVRAAHDRVSGVRFAHLPPVETLPK